MTPLEAHEKNYREGRTRAQVWLSVSLTSRIYGKDYKTYCTKKDCEREATHVLCDITGVSDGRISGWTYWARSAWCVEHRDAAFKRRPCQRVETMEQARALGDEFECNRKAHRDWCVKREQLRRQEAFDRYGRILVCSGYAGTLHELPSGQYKFKSNEGVEKAVCCYQQGLWLVDTRHRSKRLGDPKRHSDNCPLLRGGAHAAEFESHGKTSWMAVGDLAGWNRLLARVLGEEDGLTALNSKGDKVQVRIPQDR